MMRVLQRPTAPDGAGRILEVTPASAGWDYVGFAVRQLQPGQSVLHGSGDRKACLS
jgi:5-deoxy-glucuronate isomerase